MFQTPKATLDVKELRLDISKAGGSSHPSLFVKLHLFPISICLGGSRISSDSSSANGEPVSSNNAFFGMTERTSAPFTCEDFSLLCEIGHDRWFH